MKTLKYFAIIFLTFLSLNISAQLKVTSSGNVELGNIYSYNPKVSSLGAELRIGSYSYPSWEMGFVQARDNTTNPISLRFRVQKNGGSIRNVMQMYHGGDVLFWEPVYFDDGHFDISDSRLKNNVKKLEKSKINNLYSLEGKEYSRKKVVADTIVIDSGLYEKQEFGLIAQEVKEIYPEIVSQSKEGYYSINYTALIPLIIEALKEQKVKTDELKNNYEKLKSASSGSNKISDVMMGEAILYQNNPNPFSKDTEVKYFLSEDIKTAVLYIYNMQGNQIKNISLNNRGDASINIHGSELQPGMYLYTLIADGKEVDTKRMILTD